MGTKVHFRSYSPRYDKMRDLNANAGNNWSSFYINKTLNEDLHNGCCPSPSAGYSEYDKEMLKRTMLEHEAIFRKQVYELHRLYGIQKDLMEELQKNGLSGAHRVPSKTIFGSSQFQSDYATGMCHMSHLCAVNNCHKMEKLRYNDDIIYTLNFPKSNLQSSSGIFETETLQRVSGTDGSFRKCPKRMLDFRFPAGAYIDYTEKSEEIPSSYSINTSNCSRICTGDSEIELKLNLDSISGSSGKEDVRKLNHFYNKKLCTGLAVSNKPNSQTSLEGGPNSFPVMVSRSKIQAEDNHRLNFPLSSSTLSLRNAFANDGDSSEWIFSNGFQGVKEEISRGAVFHNEAGKLFPTSLMNSTSHKEKDPILCEPVMLNANKVSDIISIDHDEASTQFGHEQDNHFLICGKCPGNSESNNLGKLTSVLPNSFSNSFKLEKNITSSPLVPTWTKFSSDENHASSPFSAISRFNGSSKAKKICFSENAAKSTLRYEEKYSSHFNELNDGLQLQLLSTLQKKVPLSTINLNVEAENFFSGTQDGPISQQIIGGKCEDLLPGPSWLKRRTACESLEPSRLPFPADLGFNNTNQVYEKKFEDPTSLPSCSFENFSSSLHNRDSKVQNDPPFDSLISKKFIGPYFHELQEKLSSSSNEEKLVIDEFKHASTFHDIKLYSSEKSTSLENNRKKPRNCIDLNFAFPLNDDSDSSEISAKVQAYAPSIHSDPILVSEVAPFIYLEAPVNNITSNIESISFSCRDGLKEDLCSSEIVMKEAAENIIKLSLDGLKLNDEIQISHSATPSDNALYIFAEMILSNKNILESDAVRDGRSQHQYHVLDLFELKTLQLEETKPENLWHRPQEAENAGANERSKASLLLAMPRRVQGKKRRQKKDFQKDILPPLATLSRQESIEDLQAIGELMKASGTPWQAGIRRRNMRGNGSQAQAIQKCPQRNSRVSVSPVEINPPIPLFMVDCNNPELEVGKHHMIGWGRTTRRCRSQRCSSVSISSTLT
ncbi:uncharacterized protein LOC110024417 [Phalaenopsis equestris]|uniref:uncharacterized protein LOC110024417 n=1 Tax=Phalaenopsis equestris TaxID=78828 RepID=UPI0009E388CA|nr:uncharacterized protein LOC110024417 [Phalaenopsis equestris]